MIVAQLSGGLGNQMFQYAAGRALAARRHTELVLDSSWFAGRGGGAAEEFRRYELDCFAFDAHLTSVDRVARLPGTRASSLLRRLPRRRRPFVLELVEPPYGAPLPELVDAPDNTYLRGYWQNPSYFEDAERLLRQDFTFRPAIVERCSAHLDAIRASSEPVVSVHVRRTDYVTDTGIRDRLGALGSDYYRRAVEVVSARVGPLRVFVFTDDPEWCAARLRLGRQMTVIGASRSEREQWASLLHAMSVCNHHVIANSSFSWWAAWLNTHPHKVVVGPSPWYRDAGKPDAHRFPAGWIRVARDVHQADQPPSTTRFEPVT